MSTLRPELTEPPRAPTGTGTVQIGTAVPRIDGWAKVTGAARYAAEHPADDLCFGVVVNSTIARGRIRNIDVQAAMAVTGVLDVLTNQPAAHSLVGLLYRT